MSIPGPAVFYMNLCYISCLFCICVDCPSSNKDQLHLQTLEADSVDLVNVFFSISIRKNDQKQFVCVHVGETASFIILPQNYVSFLVLCTSPKKYRLVDILQNVTLIH